MNEATQTNYNVNIAVVEAFRASVRISGCADGGVMSIFLIRGKCCLGLASEHGRRHVRSGVQARPRHRSTRNTE